MKAVIALVCLFGVAAAEMCDGVDTTKCANEICAAGYVPTCQNNICTCNLAPKPSQCTILSDCDQYWNSHHCGNHNRVCLNGNCQCQHGHGK